MTQVPITPGRTEVQLTARGRASVDLPPLLDVPGGLYPMKSAAFEVDEYRILSGWPVPVPDGDIRIDCLVSGVGDVLGNRDAPTALVTEADMRWVADVNYYDQTTLRWAPIQGAVSPWQTAPANAPTLITDYEYRIGDERFIEMTVLNFDSDTSDYMWNDLSLNMGGTSGYTVLMVMSPNSVYGNNETLPDNTLWGPAVATGAWSLFTVKDQAIWLTTEEQPAQKGLAIGNGLATTAPTYLALVVSRPQTTLYAASGPSRVLSKALAAGAVPEPLSTSFWLGNGVSASSATMDMALLDLSIYATVLTKADVAREISSLSTVYGGDT